MSKEKDIKLPCSQASQLSQPQAEGARQVTAPLQNDKSKLKTLGSPGPFQVIDGPIIDKSNNSELDHPLEGPRRRYDCKNYEPCLNLAAALNWDSFTCRGCCGDVNEKLLWRAQHEVRKDQMAKAICDLPNPRERKIETGGGMGGLKLVVGKN